MASRALIDELIALGGTPSPNATDAELKVLIDHYKRLQGQNVVPDAQAANAAMVSGEVWDDYVPTEPEAIVPFQQMSDEELQQYITENSGKPAVAQLGQTELSARQKMDERAFLENLLDPETSSMVLGRTGGQFMAGVTNALNIPAGAAGLYGIATAPVENLTGAELGSQSALDYMFSEDARARDFWNVSQPRNMNESAASIAGELIPVPGPKKATALQDIMEVVTPFVVGGGPGRTAVNATVGLGLDQVVREAVDAEASEYQTMFDELGIPDVEEEAPLNPWAVGVLGALAVTSVAAPATIHLLHNQKFTPRTATPVIDNDPLAPKDLETLETGSDVAKAMIVDDKQVLIDLAERAGVPDFNTVKDLIDLDTQTEAVMRVNEALMNGKLHGQYGDFTAPVAPRLLFDTYKQMPKDLQDDIDLYLKLGDYSDDLRLQIASGSGPATAATTLAQIKAQRGALRQKNPSIGAFSRDYQKITEATRSYLATGPHGLLNQKANAGLAVDRPHYVPIDLTGVDPTAPLLTRMAQAQKVSMNQRTQDWFLMQRDVKNVQGVTNRANAVDTLMDYVQNALTAKLRNDVQNVYANQMMNSKSGQNTILKVKPEEAAKHPGRSFTTSVGGEIQHFLSSQLQRDLLMFDPHVITQPLMAGLYGAKRLAEVGTTSALSLTFAPTTLIRDTAVGIANSVGGAKGPSLTGIVAAVPEIVTAKFTNMIAHSLEARLKAGNPLPFLDPNLQQQIAGMAARKYMQSFTHLANEAGGFDGSLLNSRVKVAIGAMDELAKAADPLINNPLGKSLRHLAGGFGAIFNAISEAPRHSAFVENIKAGMSPKEAAKHARELTGNAFRGGKVYNADGSPIRGDTQNVVTGTVMQSLGLPIDILHNGVMYSNPAIQGMRRAFQAASTNPVEWTMRNWVTIGLPSLVAVGWNALAGKEYEEYAEHLRSERDQTMELYIAIPGKRPEEGLSIPIAHEQAFMMSPFQAVLNNMRASNEEINQAVVQSGVNILENTATVSTPVPLAVFMNLAGQKPPENLLTPWKDTYSLTERNTGFLPTNIDAAVRSLFGSVSGTYLDTAYAFVDGGYDPAAAVDELRAGVVKRTPVVKGTMGTKTNVTAFTPISSEKQRKFDAYMQFKDTWAEHYGPNAGLTSGSPITGTTTADPNSPQGDTGVTLEVPRGNMGPIPTPKPTNPVYEYFGEMIYDTMEKNGMGMTNAESRYNTLTKQIRLLKNYNAGSASDFQEYQEMLEEAPGKLADAQEVMATNDKDSQEYMAAEAGLEMLEEQTKAIKIIEDNDIDLNDRFDVTRLVSILEYERYQTMQQQLAIIQTLEDKITDQLIAQGMLPPNERFSLEKHLAPMDQSILPPQQMQ